ncbi:MAG: SMC-Scp complex subunit ScpB [Actinobacteria bacterium]|nr:SMC-Scp complex subunit ScpB [Actinomycetota bacterium]MBL7060280.1 SMC-Scp complex subunit ScpB [Actinomycetota bacterium]
MNNSTDKSKMNNNGDVDFYKDDNWLRTCIEGILFISESPVKLADISYTLKVSENKINKIIKLLENEYIEQNRGFILKRVARGFRFYSNPVIRDILKKFVKSNIRTHLSQAAIETLAIVAYKQPVTRTQIAEIRGVRTESVILTLVSKGLIKEVGKLKEPGNPIIYRTTDKFLELLGIDRLKNLPPLEDFKENGGS